MGESTRQKKFSRLIQEELSEILAREISLDGNPMLTVSVIRSSPDLRQVRVYVSVFPDNLQNSSIEALTERSREVRHILAQRIRRQVRHIPELTFYLDDTMQEVGKMDNLFDRLNLNDPKPEG